MADSFTTRLRLVQQVAGENTDTWGTKLNSAIDMLEEAIAGVASITHDDSANYTISTANNATDEARQMVLAIGGSLTAARNLIVPTKEKVYIAYNNTGQDVTVKTSSGTGKTLVDGERRWLYCDGINVVDLNSIITGVTQFVIGENAVSSLVTRGIVVNQLGSDDQILALKSSDVATVLTTGGPVNYETDDYGAFQKTSATLGGLQISSVQEDGGSAGANLTINAVGGTSNTDDDSSSVGLVNFYIAEHDGANAQINAPTNQDAFTIQTRVSGSAFTCLLVKGDDGELHLGNSTPVALDDEDDIKLTRQLQVISTQGNGIVPSPYDWSNYDHAELERLGLVGPKDGRGAFMLRVQPVLGLMMGSTWQLYNKIMDVQTQVASLNERLDALPAPV